MKFMKCGIQFELHMLKTYNDHKVKFKMHTQFFIKYSPIKEKKEHPI